MEQKQTRISTTTKLDTATPPIGPSRLSEALDRLAGRLSSPEYERRLAEVEAAERQREAEHVAIRRHEAAARVWRERGDRYRLCTLANFEAQTENQLDVLRRLSDYAENVRRRVAAGQNVVLVGPAGTGKDHLLAGLVHHALAVGLSVCWRCGSSLWIELRHAIQSQAESDVINTLVWPQVLVLSDPVPPHVEPSNYERSVLYAVIDQRYSNLRPTWVSINAANREDAEQRLGVAVADRLRDGALSLACNWPSYRRSGTGRGQSGNE